MADKLLISNLTWRSLEMQKQAFPGMPFFTVDEIPSMLRPTRRQVVDRIHVLSLAVISDTEKGVRSFLNLAKERGCHLIAKEEKQEFFFRKKADLEHIVKEWKLSRNRGASKIGARISADKKMAATKLSLEKIKDRWPMPSAVWPTTTLLEAAAVSLNTAKAHLGKRPIAQYNYQAKLKRKERKDGKI